MPGRSRPSNLSSAVLSPSSLLSSRPPRQAIPRAYLVIFGAALLGCSVSAEDYDADAGAGSTHVAVRIQHVTSPGGESRADALAGFVRVQASADAQDVLALAGLKLVLPPKGECFSDADGHRPLAIVSDAELLEASAVSLETDGGTHELAPYAFPNVADLLRGVVYLSRDRSGNALPMGATYTLMGHGIEPQNDPGLGHNPDSLNNTLEVSSTQQSPPPFAKVTVAGQPWSGSISTSAAPVLDLSWEPSDDTNDVVVVTIESEDDYFACSFADGEGFGSVPLITYVGTELGQGGRQGLLSLHRLRSRVEPGSGAIVQVRMTFDFVLQTQIYFNGASAFSDRPE